MDIQTNLNTDLRISVQTPNGRFDYDLSDILSIDEHNLNSEFISQPGTYAWWGSILESEKAVMEEKKQALLEAEAYADMNVRKELTDKGTKVTEALVTRYIATEEDFIVAKGESIKASKRVNILKQIVQALDHKKNMLMMLGSRNREDFNHSGDMNAVSSPHAKANSKTPTQSLDELKAEYRQNK